MQLLQYAQQNASFTGIEAQVRQHLSRHLGLPLFGDAVRARLHDGSLLPRIPPARAGLRRPAPACAWTPPGTPGKARWNGCK